MAHGYTNELETTSRTWRPLVVCIVLQAVLLTPALGMLSPWGDECFTLAVAGQPVPQLLDSLRADIHPPLYFLLLQGWLHLWMFGSMVVRVRLFSVLWTLVAAALADRLFAVRLSAAARGVFLALWCTSPALLLYGRMGRSYTMQVAVAMVAIAAAWQWSRSLRLRDSMVAAAALVVVLYTHYVPGLAVTAAANLLLPVRAVRAGKLRRVAGQLALADLIVAIAYAPWLFTLKHALAEWTRQGSFAANYSLTGNRAAEHLLRTAYTLTSFGIGETFSFASLLVLAGVAIALLLSARAAVRGAALLGPLVLLAGLLGYFGVAGWATYAFMPARLLWLLPFFLLWLAVLPGIARSWRMALLAGVLVSNAWSIVNYYHRDSFLNKGYVLPIPEMVALIREHSAGTPALVLIDMWNTDANAFVRGIGDNGPPTAYTGQGTLAGMPALRQQYSRIWIVRNSHDVSPGHITENVEMAACTGRARRIYGFLPCAWWERRVLDTLRLPDISYFYTVTECSSEAAR